MMRSPAPAVALALTLVPGLALAWIAAQTPKSVPASASATAFSAERAMADVNEIGRSPHPIDSVRHDQVRDYVIGRLKSLGLQVRVQTTTVFKEEHRGPTTAILGGDVQNIIAVLPGRDPTAKAVAVTAHYDSVPGSPGASDDTAGVASALETARAITAQGQPPARDVIFLITDGEEGDLLGARAFYAQNPLAKHIGAVVNMDTRGGGGRAFMFETGLGDGQMIARFRRTAVHPSSNSLAIFLYQHMPNGTDFTIPKDLGIQGVNYAFIGAQFDYHAASSTPARLERGALQNMGEQVLAISRDLAFAKALPEKRPDVVYGDVFSTFMVAYPPVVGWLILAGALLLATVAVLAAWRRGETSIGEILRGAAGAAALLLFTAALLYAARGATGVPYGFAPDRPLLAQFGLYEAALFALSLGAALLAIAGMGGGARRLWAPLAGVAVAAACLIVGGLNPVSEGCAIAAVLAALLSLIAFGRPLRPWSLIGGFLKIAAVLAIVAQALAPTMAFIIVWPLALLALAIALAGLFGRLDRPIALLTLGVAGVVSLGWILGLAHGVALGVGADLPAALAVFAWLATLSLIPLLAVQTQAASKGAVVVLVGVALIAFIGLHDPASPKHPRVTEALYVADLDHGRFERADPLARLDPWSKAALSADGGAIHRTGLIPLSDEPVFQADAKPIAIEKDPVTLTTTGDTVQIGAGPLRRLQIGIRTTTPLTGVRIGGLPSKAFAKPGVWTYLLWQASGTRAPSAPLVSFTAAGHGTVEVRYASIVQGWPKDAKPLAPRPADAMPWQSSDSTVEVGTLRKTW
jgi:hypothetical protein